MIVMALTRTSFSCLILLTAAAAPLAAQEQDPSLLTNQRIYGSTEFRAEQFGPARWFPTGTAYTTLEQGTGGGREMVRYDAATGARQVLVSAARLTPPGATSPLTVENYEWSADQRRLLIYTNSKQVWRLNTRGDYWVLDLSTGNLRQVGSFARPSTMMYAKFSPDGGRVGYVVENNLYVEDIATGNVTQLTHDGSRTIINGNFDWVYEEELSLHDGWRWSPDGARVAYWQLNADQVRDFHLIRNTDSLYSQVVPIQYPKAGEENSAARIGVVSARGGATVWVDIEGDPRNNYLARMEWADNSDELIIQRLNRLQNTLQLLLATASTGQVRTVLTESDSTWVEVVDDLRWFDGGKRFTWVSERDGWNHVYSISRDGGDVRLLTPGEFDVLNVSGVDVAGGWLYYIASPGNPAQRYLWRVRLDGKGRAERLTPAALAGTNGYNMGPGMKWAFHTHTRFDSPAVVSLVQIPGHQTVRPLAPNTRLLQAIAPLRKGTHEFTTLRGADGVRLNAWIMKPPAFDSTRRYPVLFFVYGGPGSQTVVDNWMGSQYLWHLMLTQKGYVVASVDNRGTGARGRDWRKVIYRQLGVVETRDQAAAAADLASRSWIDPDRVGIWGWSYGGFMSLNTLFQAPQVYRTAVSVAPVTHWKFYDNIYTERYNGLPQENAEGYDQGSPLSYVKNLKGDLLLVHGSGDDNVHYQNSEALINALVAANKPFQMMEYPDRNHSISGGTTSLHLRELLTRFLDEKLMATGTRTMTP
jgi:dipeptidyl-peptidase-4